MRIEAGRGAGLRSRATFTPDVRSPPGAVQAGHVDILHLLYAGTWRRLTGLQSRQSSDTTNGQLWPASSAGSMWPMGTTRPQRAASSSVFREGAFRQEGLCPVYAPHESQAAAAATILYGVEIPSSGGATSIANVRAAYLALYRGAEA